jgi:hypothetical protein
MIGRCLAEPRVWVARAIIRWARFRAEYHHAHSWHDENLVGDTNERSANAINTVGDLARIPKAFKRGIRTDEIQLIGEAVKLDATE